MAETEYKTLAEFWPYYLSEHLNPVNLWHDQINQDEVRLDPPHNFLEGVKVIRGFASEANLLGGLDNQFCN